MGSVKSVSGWPGFHPKDTSASLRLLVICSVAFFLDGSLQSLLLHEYLPAPPKGEPAPLVTGQLSGHL